MSSNTKLTDFLREAIPAASHAELCQSVLPGLIDAIAEIARALRTAHTVSQAGNANAFGDDQLNVDVLAEEAVRAAVARCPAVATASSEEDPVEKPASSRRETDDADGQMTTTTGDGAPAKETYTVAFDPLDGSSIIAPNWSVGAIFGVWAGASALHQDPATRQVAAVLGVLGPRTSAIVAVRLPGQPALCFEVGVNEGGAADSVVVRREVRLLEAAAAGTPYKMRYFAPANLRATAEHAGYQRLVTRYMADKYTLRYSGGLVPDVVHALVKGHGVYVSPVTAASRAKLRRLYEVLPIALVLECAGGRAVDPADGTDVLARPAADTDERSGLVCGNADEVEFAKTFLLE